LSESIPLDRSLRAFYEQSMHHDHTDHDHPHTLLPSDPALRVKALETILTQKGLIDPAALDKIIEAYETKIGPRNGARVVATAWTDPRLYPSGTHHFTDLEPLLLWQYDYGRTRWVVWRYVDLFLRSYKLLRGLAWGACNGI
jgi:hypothetical protein